MPKVDAKGKRLEASKFTYGDKDFKDYKDFEATYRPYAEAAVTKKMSEGKKIPVEVLLSQAYIESAGGRAPLNNNLSGLKASKSETNYGLYESPEFHKDEDYYKKFEKDGKFYADSVAFPPRKPGEYREIVSTKLVEDENSPNYGKYRYMVDSYFSHSNNVQEGFEKVIDNFYVTPNYKTAVTNDDALNNPEIFLKSISGNYATEGGYYDIVSPYLNVSMETSKKIAEEKAAIENKAKVQKVQDIVDKVMPEFVSNSVNKKPLEQDKIPFSMFAPKMKNGGVSISGNVNAEGKELILKNSYGDYAIIPKNHRAEVIDMVKEGCNNCIDSYVSQLPKMHNYAKDGTVIPNPDDYESFNKFRTTLPKNLKETKYEYGSPDNEYDLYGYWESFNKPKTFGTMLFQNPDYKRQDDGMYHGISRNPKTGQLLKSPSHEKFTLGVYEDRTKGYQTYYGKDGKMYSHRPGEIKWNNFDKPYKKAANGLVIDGDLSKVGSKVKPSADANTYNAPTSTIQPVNPNINSNLIGKTWDDIPTNAPNYNQPQLKQDTRTDYEREQDQKAMEDYQNPNFIEQLWSGARMVPRAIADPIQGVGQIFDAVGLGDTRIGQDLGNFNDEEAAYRYRNVNPNTSAGEKFMGNLGEGSEVAAWGATNFIPFESSVINPVVKGLVGKGNYSSYLANPLYSPAVNQGVKEVVENSVVTQVSDVVNPIEKFIIKEPKTNTLQLKSTMMGSQFEKQLSKTGELNVNNILAHISKQETSAADRYIIDKVLKEKFATKTSINYNEFKAAISDELVPLNKFTTSGYADYGIDRIGYHTKNTKPIMNLDDEIIGYTEMINDPTTDANLRIGYRTHLDDLLKIKENELLVPKQNETIIFRNAEKFGRGNSKHFDEALGHSRIMVTNQEPEIMHVLESQSDFYQGYNINLKKYDLVRMKESISKREISYLEDLERLKKFKETRLTEDGNPMHDSQINQYEDIVKQKEIELKYLKGDIANPEQKMFLGKTHQERFLQENIDYAAKNGQTKMRYPTSETAAKIEGYTKQSRTRPIVAENELDAIPTTIDLNTNTNYYTGNDYLPEHKTILKKYDDAPKMIKKTIGVEPKLVTDAKGNTWYEFDIPEKFIKNKAEIKALTTIPVGVGTAGAIGASQQKNNNTNSQ